jgi:dTDP-4-amino-4,6-dideoxygalactose transaminase
VTYTIPLYRVHMPAEAVAAAAAALSSQSVAAGPNVAAFELMFAEWLGNPSVVAMGDASTALAISLYLAGVRPGHRVIASPMACLATNAAIRALFAEPVWCDIDPSTGNLCARDLEVCLRKGAQAIVVFHWAGNPADLAGIYAVAHPAGVPVVEDASEAMGAEYGPKRIGCTGSGSTVFSLYANRHITSVDGALVSFASPEVAARALKVRRFGIDLQRFRTPDGEIDPLCDIDETGWNSCMTNVAASIAIEQMRYLPSLLERCRNNSDYYDEALADIGGIRPLKKVSGARSAAWVYTLLADQPAALARSLRMRGIQASAVHYRNDRYSAFAPADRDLPGVAEFSSRTLSVPCGWWIDDDARANIVRCLREAR